MNLLEAHPTYFDSLKLIRLLQPGLKQYKLKALLEVLHLEGTNSHLADEDVMATVSLVGYCRQQATQIIPAQQQFLARQRVQNCAATLRQRYSKLFNKHHAQLYSLHTHPQMPAMMLVIDEFYHFLVAENYILRCLILPMLMPIYKVICYRAARQKLDSAVTSAYYGTQHPERGRPLW